MKSFILCFVPLFVAVDAIGVLPMFFSLTQGIPTGVVRRIIFQSVITATIVALLFVAVGTTILKLLGITIADFMVAGGILLFGLCIVDVLTTEKVALKLDAESLGAVPLGVPLITGPAVLTTSILLVNEYGIIVTAGAIVINVLIAGVTFFFAEFINRLLGKAGANIVSKIANLLLAAIAIMMVRKGILLIVSTVH
jgi:multiple antibiotic resistance protein